MLLHFNNATFRFYIQNVNITTNVINQQKTAIQYL